MSILEIDDIHVAYGNIQAIRGVTLHVEEGEIVTLIGSNGAGKTTTLKTISGVRRPSPGKIAFAGERIDRMPAHEIVARGVCQAPEGRRIFPRMTVRENLEMGAYHRGRADVREDFARVLSLFPVLEERIGQAGGTLSGGEQQMLAIGRALMARPRVLLLDEPSLGLAPKFVERIFEIIKEINAQGTTVLLVEQNAQLALQTAARGYVLESGRVVLEDRASNLLTDERVRKAYLGET